MPVLNINEDERNAVIAALHHERVRLAGEWSKAFDDDEGSGFHRDSELERLAEAIDLTTDLRRKIEVAADISKSAWHNEYGWLTKSFFESDRGKATYEAALQAVEDNVTGPGLTPDEARKRSQGEFVEVDFDDLVEVEAENLREQDQIAPGTWTTLPDGYEVDADPYEVTDPKEPKVKRIEIKIDGVTRTVYSTDRNIEELERALVDVQTAQRAYLDGCVSEMVS